jgi:hypothetical protein
MRDGKSPDPGWKKFGSGIWDKHPGSATLLLCQFMNILGCPLSLVGFFIWLMMPLGVHSAGQEGAGRVRVGVRRARPHLLQELLQRALPAQEVRHGRHSGLFLRGHGELGPRHLQVRGRVLFAESRILI